MAETSVSLDLSAALAVAERAALECGPQLRAAFGNVSYTNKSGDADDVVTQLDTETEERVAETLQTFDSGVGVCGEEFGGSREGTHWLIDPIDGTGLFVRGIAMCTTMIALIDKDEPVVSVIYDFVRDRLYSCARGQGATVNGEALEVSQRELAGSYFGLEMDITVENNLDLFSQMQRTTTMFVNTINCGWDLAMVAEGRLDGRISKQPFGHDYDYAPGALLVREAGGVVANIGVHSYRASNTSFLAANPIAYADLTAPDGLFPTP